MKLKGKYRLLAIDVDGTLLGPDHEISPSTSHALLEAIAAGWIVCICTGRNYTEAKPYLQQLESRGPGVFVSGAIACDVQTGRTLFRHEIRPETARQIVELYRASGYGVLVLSDPHAAGWEYVHLPGEREHPRLSVWLSNTPCDVRDLSEVPDWDAVLRIGVIGDSDELADIHRQISTRFGQQINHHTIRVPNHNMTVHETLAPEANKWNAVRRVGTALGIEKDRIIAIGDDVNDVPMLRGAGLGVAMGNASNATRRAADIIIPPNTQDGLAIFLRRLLSGEVPP
jgi:Cof subfamily protein (haloacid dehalogenase superfamily)